MTYINIRNNFLEHTKRGEMEDKQLLLLIQFFLNLVFFWCTTITKLPPIFPSGGNFFMTFYHMGQLVLVASKFQNELILNYKAISTFEGIIIRVYTHGFQFMFFTHYFSIIITIP